MTLLGTDPRRTLGLLAVAAVLSPFILAAELTRMIGTPCVVVRVA